MSDSMIHIGNRPFDPISAMFPQLKIPGPQIDSELCKHPHIGAGGRREKTTTKELLRSSALCQAVCGLEWRQERESSSWLKAGE